MKDEKEVTVPAPRSFGNLPPWIDKELEEPILPDGRRIPSPSSKSGTMTSIQAFCPRCSSGKVKLETTANVFLEMRGHKALVLCSQCGTKHEITFIVDKSE